MKILIADDDPIARRLLEATLKRWGHDVLAVADGEAAWAVLQTPERPPLAILDWLMPGLDGPDVCRRARRQTAELGPLSLFLLTSRGDRADLVAGLEAGADDYLTKPFDPAELQARLLVGIRLLGLQLALRDRVNELEEALARVKQLQGLLPICAWCNKIRDDQNYWQKVEDYLSHRTDARFTHGICPPCLEQQMERIRKPS